MYFAEKTDEEDEDDDDVEALKKPDAAKKTSIHLNVPKASSRPSSPAPSIGLSTGDKGKSKITGKTLTGWI